MLTNGALPGEANPLGIPSAQQQHEALRPAIVYASTPVQNTGYEAVVAPTTAREYLVEGTIHAARQALQNLIESLYVAMADRYGLTLDEYHKMYAYVEKNRDAWSVHGAPFVVRHDESGVYPDDQSIPQSGLARSLLVVPQGDVAVKVYALLKQKGKWVALGRGTYKKATWALDLDTHGRKVFLSERREAYRANKPHPLTDNERRGLLQYARIPYFSGGPVVIYRHKALNKSPVAAGKEKRGVLVDPLLGGNLSDYLCIYGRPSKRSATLSYLQINSIALDIALALAIMSAYLDAHLDIKPENVLLNNEGRAKLGDFTFISKVGTLRSRVGTPAFQAPELIFESNAMVSGKEDVWSFGMTLIDLLNKTHCYAATDMNYESGVFMPGGISDFYNSNSVLQTWKACHLRNRNLPGTLDSILDRCLQLDPITRMNPQELLTAMVALIPELSLEKLTEGWTPRRVFGQEGFASKPMTKEEASVATLVAKQLNRPFFATQVEFEKCVVWIGPPCTSESIAEMTKDWTSKTFESQEWRESMPICKENVDFASAAGTIQKRNFTITETENGQFVVAMGPPLQSGSFEEITHGWTRSQSGNLTGIQSVAMKKGEAESALTVFEKLDRPAWMKPVGGGMYKVWVGPPQGAKLNEIIDAAQLGKVGVVYKYLLSLKTAEAKKVALENVDQGGATLMHWVANSGNEDMVTKILKVFEDQTTIHSALERMDDKGKTPLHWALARYNSGATTAFMAAMLPEFATKVLFQQTDCGGETLFQLAIQTNNIVIIKSMIATFRYEDDIRMALESPFPHGPTPLQHAVANSSAETVYLLLETLKTAEAKRALIEKKNAYGQNLLYAAVCRDNYQIVKVVLTALESNEARLAAMTRQDNEKRTAFLIAHIKGNPDVMREMNQIVEK